MDNEADQMDTPIVGYVYDIRMKYHRELTDTTSLESTDSTMLSLKEKSHNYSYKGDKRRDNKHYSNRSNEYRKKQQPDSRKDSSWMTDSSNWNDQDEISNKLNQSKINSQTTGQTGWGNSSNTFQDQQKDDSRLSKSNESYTIDTSGTKQGKYSRSDTRDYKNSRKEKNNQYYSSYNNQNFSSGRENRNPGSSRDCNSYNGTDEPEQTFDDNRRPFAIHSILDASGCLQRMTKIKSREATIDELRLVHTEKHCKIISDTSCMEKSKLLEVEEKNDAIFVTRETDYCARLCVGSVIDLCAAVAKGEIDCGFAITRPPGHHARMDQAIAVMELRRTKLATRVMIVDWDIHHGNGIQEVFLEDPDVLYFSIHRYENGNFYPCTEEGTSANVGKFEGSGRNVNVAWQDGGMNDGDYLYVFDQLVLPMAKEFNPELIIVACGFDSAQGDPIGQCNITPQCYSIMTHALLTLTNKGAGGKVVLVLEGGYNLEVTANSALACVKAMLWEPFNDGLVPREGPLIHQGKPKESGGNMHSSQKTAIALAELASVNFDSDSSELAKLINDTFFLPKLKEFWPCSHAASVVNHVLNYHKPYWKFIQDLDEKNARK
ncbi:hypothetical protein BB559_006614 [Furculomyces boomerangus]|uniref:histone deacetylase n=1 Tax=Furculomyces boomerangus TaxID=61424 RepID=A0A2T9Y1K2_9FUNG|nr:hypothetical protein BB559_006614 [Furculomyces boomerangus]